MGLIITALSIFSANAQWQTNGPGGIAIKSLAVTNSGSLSVEPGVFAGAQWAGAFLSPDNGASWSAVDTGLPNASVYSFAIKDTNIFAGTNEGVFLSTNNGSNWSILDTNGLPRNAIIYSVVFSGSTLFASTYGSGVFLSNDNGLRWFRANNGLPSPGNTYVVAFAVSGSSVFAASQSNGVYLSTDNGQSWSGVNTGLENPYIASLVVNGTNVFAGTYGGGVFLSTDNGANWMPVNSGLTNLVIHTLCTGGSWLPAGEQGIFAGTDDGVFLSTNNGASWTPIGLSNNIINALAASDSTIFAGTDSNGVWQQTLSNFPLGIKETPASPSTLFTLYPNPVSEGTVQLAFSDGLIGSKMEMYNITGQMLFSQTIESTKTTLDISALPAGIYSVSLISANGMLTQKLVIAK